MSEPGAGSDIAGIRCRADLDGDEWVINGQKMWATFALGSDFIVLVARTEPYDIGTIATPGSASSTSRRSPASFPDGIDGTAMRKIGYHGWRTWELSFDNYRIPKGEPDRARKNAPLRRMRVQAHGAVHGGAPGSHRRARDRSGPGLPGRLDRNTPRSASSSRSGSRTSSTRASASPTWRPRSRRRALSPTRWPTTRTRA